MPLHSLFALFAICSGAATGSGPNPGICSTLGPATLQNGVTRQGGTPMAGVHAITPAQCAAQCCDRFPCRSWVFRGDNCSLLGGYSAPALPTTLSLAASPVVSGVVYRQRVQDAAYSGVRGFNYVPPTAVNDIDMWVKYDPAVTARDMAIAQAAGFNFCRVFLNYHVWVADPAGFVAKVTHFVATAHAHGIETMPIAFDLCWFGCTNETVSSKSSGRCWYPSPQYSLADDKAWWTASGEPYVDALVTALPPGTPGLKLWDVVNEPETGGRSGLPGDKGGPRWQFVEHFVKYFQSRTRTPTTVGVASVGSLAVVGAVVDVLSFHSYHATWELGLERTELGLGFGRTFGKPVFNSETGCIARANPYDQTIEMAVRNGIGFAVWELMISDCVDCVDTRRWKHGLMFVDGTTRDPSAIAAIHGVYLNRGDNVGLAVPRPDVEGTATDTATRGRAWLRDNATADYLAGTALLDELSGISESAQTLPLVIALSGQARALASAGDTPLTRSNLTKLLGDQIANLVATKMGAESAPGVCEYAGAEPCVRPGCDMLADDDYASFKYSPESTPVLYHCWTAAVGTPGNGTLHYCDKNGSVAFVVPAAAAGSGRPVTAVDLVYKAGPDCGKLSVTHGGTSVLNGFDTFAPIPHWTASVRLATELAQSAEHSFVITVDGTKSPGSVNTYVQIVGVRVWFSTSTF